jgi:adenine-specific DNA-methyltransferase
MMSRRPSAAQTRQTRRVSNFVLTDAPETRKARGAFFTPEGITEHLAEWALRDVEDLVLEPSAGEAAFLVAAVNRLRALGNENPDVYGVEVHAPSARTASARIRAAGGTAHIKVSDFFLTAPSARYSAVIGNPPFVRYQDFSGESRDRARFAALQQGVALTGLASAWAAFVVHSAAHLKPGGRLGLVLPAELLSVNYAAPVRRFLLENFASVELVVFDEQVFPDAEADTVLVKAEGWKEAPAPAAKLRQTRNARTLGSLAEGVTWAPADTAERWTAVRLTAKTIDTATALLADGFVPLSEYGDTTLGAVTGANHYFALSPARVLELDIPRADLVRISPPGSSHLRGLDLTSAAVNQLGADGASTWLFRPGKDPSEAALRYIDSGHQTGVDEAYKCRVRTPWWRVPILAPADILLTYMNADTPRLTTNTAAVRHINSVHGVYVRDEYRELARDVLPIASLNSMTLLSAELAGRSYGGGILKLEPREADRWWMPSPASLVANREALVAAKPRIRQLLRSKRLLDAVAIVDAILLNDRVSAEAIEAIRADRALMTTRRTVRGRSGRTN